MTTANTSEGGGASGRVEIAVHDEAVAALHDSTIPALPSAAKRRALAGLPPMRTHDGGNIVVDEWLEEVARGLDASEPPVRQPSHFAVGDDDTAPAAGNTALNSEVFRDRLSAESHSGREYRATGFLDSGQANGEDIKEAGLFTDIQGGADETMVNHSTSFQDETKGSGETVTLNFTITWSDN
jgi:hypothetical protein